MLAPLKNSHADYMSFLANAYAPRVEKETYDA
jgi:hypothetical protein